MTRDRWNGIFTAGVVCVVLTAAPVAAKLTPAEQCASKKDRKSVV